MKDTFPLEIKRGNAAVNIYRLKNRGYVEYRLAWYGPDGKRQVKSYSDLQKAKDEAASKANELSRGEIVSLDLTGADRLAYIRAVETLKPFGIPLEIATMQFAEASKLLPGVSLVDAAKFYRKRNNLDAPQKTVLECCAEMIAAKKADGLSHRHVKDLNNRCGTFAKSFSCNIGNVSDADISGWLRGLDVSGRTRNNYRMAIIALFRFAATQGYIPKDHLDADKIASAKKRTGAIEIFTPNQIAALLAGADDETRPFIALGAFAGLRSSEIERLDWSNIDLQRDFITVHAQKGTAQRRLVPILPNLREWLLPIAKPDGQFWRFKNTQKPIARLVKKTGIPWKTNALRHSFISYRVAQIQNVAQVALECGNSPTMIFRNYRELVKPSDAETWFAVAPRGQEQEKIIPLATAVQ
jgi:integrase